MSAPPAPLGFQKTDCLWMLIISVVFGLLNDFVARHRDRVSLAQAGELPKKRNPSVCWGRSGGLLGPYVRDEAHCKNAAAHMHENLVKAGCVHKPEDWA